ncbi:protein PBDC1 isoform X1 [Nerophis ophidion]|uniref:protein PBDC1 isoform X1 n=1 Tax=Nerophis ophidion TaxID=159077 RepID=UPI002ADF63FF|nr:protein PBDC1 isoform X1 [Nerophis ophidion]
MASSNGLASLGADGAVAPAHALSLSADAYENDGQLELMWAMKAYNHAEVYFNLISSVDPKFLKLTKMDDEIYASFKEAFGWKFRRNLGEWLPREIIGRGTEIQESPGKMGRVGKYGETSRGTGVQVLFCFQLISSVDLKLTKIDDDSTRLSRKRLGGNLEKFGRMVAPGDYRDGH